MSGCYSIYKRLYRDLTIEAWAGKEQNKSQDSEVWESERGIRNPNFSWRRKKVGDVFGLVRAGSDFSRFSTLA